MDNCEQFWTSLNHVWPYLTIFEQFNQLLNIYTYIYLVFEEKKLWHEQTFTFYFSLILIFKSGNYFKTVTSYFFFFFLSSRPEVRFKKVESTGGRVECMVCARCEVSAEAPLFNTVSQSKRLQVTPDTWHLGLSKNLCMHKKFLYIKNIKSFYL